jgi:hypothetical protein
MYFYGIIPTVFYHTYQIPNTIPTKVLYVKNTYHTILHTYEPKVYLLLSLSAESEFFFVREVYVGMYGSFPFRACFLFFPQFLVPPPPPSMQCMVWYHAVTDAGKYETTNCRHRSTTSTH